LIFVHQPRYSESITWFQVNKSLKQWFTLIVTGRFNILFWYCRLGQKFRLFWINRVLGPIVTTFEFVYVYSFELELAWTIWISRQLHWIASWRFWIYWMLAEFELSRWRAIKIRQDDLLGWLFYIERQAWMCPFQIHMVNSDSVSIGMSLGWTRTTLAAARWRLVLNGYALLFERLEGFHFNRNFEQRFLQTTHERILFLFAPMIVQNGVVLTINSV
jgi:hypothetical protein